MTTMWNSKIEAAILCGNIKRIILCLAVFASLVGFAACRSGENTPGDSAAVPTATAEKGDDSEQNLSSAQRAGFDFIFIFRRPDGGVFTGEDKKFLKENSPPETNQWLLSEDGKTVTAGSNYKFTTPHLENLRKRFTVEDYSKPPPIDENANQNASVANGNQNSNREK